MTLKIPNYRWGIELECFGRFPRPQDLVFFTDYSGDFSIKPRNRNQKSIELKTATMGEIDYDKLRHDLKLLIEKEFSVNYSCGIHFHVSLTNGRRFDWKTMREKVQRYLKSVWERRQDYCCSSFESSKYNPVNKISSEHCEIRIFNATLNFRAWLHYIKIVESLVGNVI